MQRVLTGRHIGRRRGKKEGRGAGRPKVCVRCGRDIGVSPPAPPSRVPVIFGDRVIQPELFPFLLLQTRGTRLTEARLGDKDRPDTWSERSPMLAWYSLLGIELVWRWVSFSRIPFNRRWSWESCDSFLRTSKGWKEKFVRKKKYRGRKSVETDLGFLFQIRIRGDAN